jgi:hypothetical protein
MCFSENMDLLFVCVCKVIATWKLRLSVSSVMLRETEGDHKNRKNLNIIWREPLLGLSQYTWRRQAPATTCHCYKNTTRAGFFFFCGELEPVFVHRSEPIYLTGFGPWSLIRVTLEMILGSGCSTQDLKPPKTVSTTVSTGDSSNLQSAQHRYFLADSILMAPEMVVIFNRP